MVSRKFDCWFTGSREVRSVTRRNCELCRLNFVGILSGASLFRQAMIRKKKLINNLGPYHARCESFALSSAFSPPELYCTSEKRLACLMEYIQLWASMTILILTHGIDYAGDSIKALFDQVTPVTMFTTVFNGDISTRYRFRVERGYMQTWSETQVFGEADMWKIFFSLQEL